MKKIHKGKTHWDWDEKEYINLKKRKMIN